MGFYMGFFWFTFIILAILFLINMNLKNRRLDSLVGFLVIVQFVLFILALSSKDLFFEWIGIPTAWELTGEGILSAFALWKYYLDPMKRRINRLEVHAGKLETKMDGISENVIWIRDNFIKSRS